MFELRQHCPVKIALYTSKHTTLECTVLIEVSELRHSATVCMDKPRSRLLGNKSWH